MDNVTHALWGLGIYGGWAALSHANLHTALAAGVCTAAVLGSEAPDADVVIQVVAGPIAYLRQHRAISHSIPMWFVWPLVIAALLSLWQPGHFGLFFFVALVGVLIHVGLDVLTTYGTQALWPLSGRRWAYDALFIVDIVYLICGALGIILALWRWTVPQAAMVFGGIAVVYTLVRLLQSRVLWHRVRRQFPEPWRLSVIPGPLPWWWSYVAQRPEAISAGRVRPDGTAEAQIQWVKPQADSEAVRFALSSTRVGKVFRWFARHLLVREKVEGDTVRVVMADVTYRYNRLLPFTASVTLKRHGDRFETVAESVRAQDVDMGALLEDAVNPDDGPHPSAELVDPGR
ncbi:MAG: metal-dependent hydrolase [Thermoflavifilum sp.]|nr:metal-dependent hydrolase [Thermoflavifilum sp.]MCL6514297.1 metal-dependent hydrolase [Alicyclobacillus sp.]